MPKDQRHTKAKLKDLCKILEKVDDAEFQGAEIYETISKDEDGNDVRELHMYIVTKDDEAPLADDDDTE